MFEPIPGHDEWKTRVPEEKNDLNRPFRKDDPCTCGHQHQDHMPVGLECVGDDEDCACLAFNFDYDRYESKARIEAENAILSEIGEGL